MKKTFMFLWIIPYFAFVYLVSNPSYPRYFLPIVPPIIVALVSVAWSKARSTRDSMGRQNIRRRLLFSLVIILIMLGFINSARLAATIHTTPVPMVQLTQYIKQNYDQNSVYVIGFHEYKAFQYYLSGYRYFSAQYQTVEVFEILRNFSSKNQTVLITETSVRYILGPQIQRLGLKKAEIARFEMDPHVETEQHTIILYRLSAS